MNTLPFSLMQFQKLDRQPVGTPFLASAGSDSMNAVPTVTDLIVRHSNYGERRFAISIWMTAFKRYVSVGVIEHLWPLCRIANSRSFLLRFISQGIRATFIFRCTMARRAPKSLQIA